MYSTLDQRQIHKDLQIQIHSRLSHTWAAPSRLAINSGTVSEQPCGQSALHRYYFPQPDWRPLTASECALLVNSAPRTEHDLAYSLFIFFLPTPLYARFCELDLAKLFMPSALPSIES